LGSESIVDECEWKALQNDGIPEGGASSFSRTSDDCECCMYELDPQSSECAQFFDNLCNPRAGLETYSSSATYQKGAIVWAFVGGTYGKYQLNANTAFNKHPSAGGTINGQPIWTALGTCSCDNTCGAKTTKFNV
jgi:hypothetical protein